MESTARETSIISSNNGFKSYPSSGSLASTATTSSAESVSASYSPTSSSLPTTCDGASQSLYPQTIRGTSTVRFTSVHVRVYNRTVGDHPDVTRGAPMTLDWEYRDQSDMDIACFEETRQGQRKKFLRLSASYRNSLLQNEFKVPFLDLEEAAKAAEEIRSQREESSQDSDSVWSGFERRKSKQIKKSSHKGGNKQTRGGGGRLGLLKTLGRRSRQGLIP
ncbi:hypothetical protein ACA910_018419 [Epithemia clementina (nom. ined.)]